MYVLLNKTVCDLMNRKVLTFPFPSRSFLNTKRI